MLITNFSIFSEFTIDFNKYEKSLFRDKMKKLGWTIQMIAFLKGSVWKKFNSQIV